MGCVMEEKVNEYSMPEVSEEVVEEVSASSKYIKEEPIKYLLNPENKQVFEASDALLKRRDLVPCTKEGKCICDHRIF